MNDLYYSNGSTDSVRIGNENARPNITDRTPLFMHELCEALGWQGGTIHQVIEEVKSLKQFYDSVSLGLSANSKEAYAQGLRDGQAEQAQVAIMSMDELFDEAFESIKGIERSIRNIRKNIFGEEDTNAAGN